MKKIYGVSRSRDKKGKIVKRTLKPYTMCIHASVGGGRETMWVLIAEIDDIDNDNTMIKELTNQAEIDARKSLCERRQECGDYTPQTDAERDALTEHEEVWRKWLRKPSGKGWCFDWANGKWFRIRKLTTRECFRLMGLRDAEIDKIQSTDLSKTQQYKMTGNSIVVDVMYHMFENLFYGEDIEEDEPLLFNL